VSSRPHSLASAFPAELTCVSPSERESGVALTPLRAKRLSRTPHADSAVLDRELVGRGVTNGQIARDWNVTERVVRDVRSGKKPFTVARLMRCRRSVREAILHLLLAMSEAAPVIDVEGESVP
jgi:hypothetical protein